VKLTRILK